MVPPSPLSPFRVIPTISPFSPTTDGSMPPHSLFSPRSPQSSHPSLLSIPPWMSPLSLSLSPPLFSLSDSHQSPHSYVSSLPSQSHHGRSLSMSPSQPSPSECPFSVSPQSPLNFPSQSHCGHSLLMSPSQHPLPSSPSVLPFSPMPSDQPHTRATFPLELTHSQAPASKPASLYKHFLLCLDRLPQPKTGLEDWSSYTSTDFHTGSQPENQVV